MTDEKYGQPVSSHIYHLVSLLSQVDHLVKEEGRLYAKNGLTDEDRARLAEVEVALDQCGDLLQQRRPLREFGKNRAKTEAREAKVAQNYEQ